MAKYWAVVTVAGSTLADITIDETYVPLGPSNTGSIGGHRVLDSASDPIPFVFHARGVKTFPVTLGIVLSPLPSGADIKFNPPDYKIPQSGTLSVNGNIPIKSAGAATAQPTTGNVAPATKKAAAKKGVNNQ